MDQQGLLVIDNMPVSVFDPEPPTSSSSTSGEVKYLAEACISALQIASQLARNSEQFFPTLTKVFTAKKLGSMLRSTVAVIRAKTCNLIGNLCRHSDQFYHMLQVDVNLGTTVGSPGRNRNSLTLVDLLASCCADSDSATRKFSSFAGKQIFLLKRVYLLLL